ncbi:MAG: hypothetical protein HYW15_01155 [Candidatus Giovannonibacteria bacterium]|nr:MAG: hypothetical protein HYW15_01155 [Candidatus Giovannonibacteria bacterium]
MPPTTSGRGKFPADSGGKEDLKMKYGELTLGQVEAIVNKIGGVDGVRRLLAGELSVRATEESKLLELLGTVTIPARAERFVVAEKFVVDTSENAKVKISYLGENLKALFLGKTENPMGESSLCYHKLCRYSRDIPIISELGEEKAETTLAEIYVLLERQRNGKKGVLLTNGAANIFYVRNIHGDLCAVLALCREDGWLVNAYSVGSPRVWNVGILVFSRN